MPWQASSNRHEATVHTQGVSFDGYDTTTQNGSFTVYNYRPQAQLTDRNTSKVIQVGETLKFEVRAWDPEQHSTTIQFNMNGTSSETRTLSTPPASKPGSGNITFELALPEGEYTNPSVTLTDAYGAMYTTTLTGTYRVKDAMGHFKDSSGAIEKEGDDFVWMSGVTDVELSQTVSNDTQGGVIKSNKDFNSVSMQVIADGDQNYLNSTLNPEQYDAYSAAYETDLMNFAVDQWGKEVKIAAIDYIPGEEINYDILFDDLENDFPGLTAVQKVSDTVDAALKQPKTGSIYMTVNHDPTIFENTVPVHSKHMPAETQVNAFINTNLVTQVDEIKIGQWDIMYKASDNTGNLPFDKESPEAVTTIFIHRPPVAKTYISDRPTTIEVAAGPSYDLDRESQHNNGITNYIHTYMTSDGTWHNGSTGSPYSSIPRQVGGLDVVKRAVKVFDNFNRTDTAYDIINLNLQAYLTVDKPKPEMLKTGDTVTGTFTITTTENITNVSSWVEGWTSSTRNMTFVNQVGNVYTYRTTFTVPSGIADDDYFVLARVQTAEGSDETRFAEISVLNNRPPQHVSFSQSPSLAYTGDTVVGTFTIDDLDDQVLTQNIVIRKDGQAFNTLSRTIAPNGSTYDPYDVTLMNNADHGTYTITSTLTDPFGATDTAVYTVNVEKFIISGTMLPADPMAGDNLIWQIHSEGGIDRFELILDPEVITTDERDTMGYDAATYPVTWNVNGGTDVKDNTLDYILWCTTTQSLTLKGVRNRGAYDFTIRAYIGSEYRDLIFTREVTGDVRELIKTGFETQ